MATFPLVRGASEPDTGHKSLGGLWRRKSLAAKRGLGRDTKEASPLEVPCLQLPAQPPPARHQPAVACSGMAPGGSVPSPELSPHHVLSLLPK